MIVELPLPVVRPDLPEFDPGRTEMPGDVAAHIDLESLENPVLPQPESGLVGLHPDDDDLSSVDRGPGGRARRNTKGQEQKHENGTHTPWLAPRSGHRMNTERRQVNLSAKGLTAAAGFRPRRPSDAPASTQLRAPWGSGTAPRLPRSVTMPIMSSQ